MLNYFKYTITNQEDNHVKAILHINEKHAIFKGHFPDFPVLPGVCQVQIIKEVAGKGIKRKLQLKKARSIKFLSMLDPCKKNSIYTEILYNIESENSVKINAKIYSDEEIYLKLIAEFDKIE